MDIAFTCLAIIRDVSKYLSSFFSESGHGHSTQLEVGLHHLPVCTNPGINISQTRFQFAWSVYPTVLWHYIHIILGVICIAMVAQIMLWHVVTFGLNSTYVVQHTGFCHWDRSESSIKHFHSKTTSKMLSKVPMVSDIESSRQVGLILPCIRFLGLQRCHDERTTSVVWIFSLNKTSPLFYDWPRHLLTDNYGVADV